MRPILALALAPLAAASFATAQAREGQVRTGTLASALRQDYERSTHAWGNRMLAAKPSEREAIAAQCPSTRDYAGRIYATQLACSFALGLQHQAPDAEALLFVVEHHEHEGPRCQSIARLLEHHIEDQAAMARLARQLAGELSSTAIDALRTLSSSAHAEPRIPAQFGMAANTLQRAEAAAIYRDADDSMRKRFVQNLGLATCQQLEGFDGSAAGAAAIEQLRKLAKDPEAAAVPARFAASNPARISSPMPSSGGDNYAEMAKTLLARLDRLAIGAQAPEIAGEDSDGRHFRLSDYRGQVVLLDFWAHW